MIHKSVNSFQSLFMQRNKEKVVKFPETLRADETHFLQRFSIWQTAGSSRFIFASAERLGNKIYIIKHVIVSAFVSLKSNFRVSYFVFSIFGKNETWNLETHISVFSVTLKRKVLHWCNNSIFTYFEDKVKW